MSYNYALWSCLVVKGNLWQQTVQIYGDSTWRKYMHASRTDSDEGPWKLANYQFARSSLYWVKQKTAALYAQSLRLDEWNYTTYRLILVDIYDLVSSLPMPIWSSCFLQNQKLSLLEHAQKSPARCLSFMSSRMASSFHSQNFSYLTKLMLIVHTRMLIVHIIQTAFPTAAIKGLQMMSNVMMGTN